MKYKWNDELIKKHYERTLRYAKEEHWGFTDNELDNPYLSKLNKQTKSKRILRMISLAYTLGKLKGIQEIDESKTPIVFK